MKRAFRFLLMMTVITAVMVTVQTLFPSPALDCLEPGYTGYKKFNEYLMMCT